LLTSHGEVLAAGAIPVRRTGFHPIRSAAHPKVCAQEERQSLGGVPTGGGFSSPNKWCDAMRLRPLTRPTPTASPTGCQAKWRASRLMVGQRRSARTSLRPKVKDRPLRAQTTTPK
jgi:hypothetical protein